MAKQDPNPPPWDDSMSDGCSYVPDWLPWVGSMLKCCITHDRRWHYGGGDKEFALSNEEFEDCIEALKGTGWFSKCYLCKAVAWWRRRGVKHLGSSAFNWLGSGDPEWRKEKQHEI